MPLLTNTTFMDFTLCGDAVSVQSTPSEVDIIDLQITKVAACAYAVVGGEICYTVTIFNNSETELTDVLFRDPLAANLEYVEESFEVDGDAEEPTIVGNELQYTFDTIAPGATIEVEFCVTVSAAN